MFNLLPTKGATKVLRELLIMLVLGSILLVSGGGNSTTEATATTSEATDTDFDATDWSEETHNNSADPNFYEVFDDTQVRHIDFVVTQESWMI